MKTRVWLVEVKANGRWVPWLPFLGKEAAVCCMESMSGAVFKRVTEYVPKARKRRGK